VRFRRRDGTGFPTGGSLGQREVLCAAIATYKPGFTLILSAELERPTAGTRHADGGDVERGRGNRGTVASLLATNLSLQLQRRLQTDVPKQFEHRALAGPFSGLEVTWLIR
jgi:hypothetical protein